MVGFVTIAETAKDFDGLFLVGRLDDDGLEAAGEGGVFFDVLAVFIERGGTDALNLATGEGGLEHVGGVDGPLGTAGTDEGVQLIDKEDHVFGAADFVHDGLDALFELAAVFGAGDHHGEIKDDDALVGENLGDIVGDDLLRETFDDGGLADAGFAEEDGVVLSAAAEDLHDAFDLIGAADDGVERAFTGELRQIASEGVERGGFGFGFAFALGFASICAFRFHACT